MKFFLSVTCIVAFWGAVSTEISVANTNVFSKTLSNGTTMTISCLTSTNVPAIVIPSEFWAWSNKAVASGLEVSLVNTGQPERVEVYSLIISKGQVRTALTNREISMNLWSGQPSPKFFDVAHDFRGTAFLYEEGGNLLVQTFFEGTKPKDRNQESMLMGFRITNPKDELYQKAYPAKVASMRGEMSYRSLLSTLDSEGDNQVLSAKFVGSFERNDLSAIVNMARRTNAFVFDGKGWIKKP